MRERPPAKLVDLLSRLRLARPEDVARMHGRVRRLAGDLPAFESVWIDALAQARKLTPYQAAEINAGRGERLLVGPFTLVAPLENLGYAETFIARQAESRQLFRLAVVREPLPPAALGLPQLVQRSTPVVSNYLSLFTQAGFDETVAWAASPHVEGQSLYDWMVENGRFPPRGVLTLARQMAAGLAELARHSLPHGDVGARTVLLRRNGEITLWRPGLRALLRPEEGYGRRELPPEAYDGLAPERIALGMAPTPASDVFACGCLWWRLLTGRPPLAGGDSLTKLKAAAAARIPDVRKLAPETPARLAETIAACVAADPQQRPSFDRLRELLGEPEPREERTLARLARRRTGAKLRYSARVLANSRQTPLWLATAAGIAIVVGGLLWPALTGEREQEALPAVSIADMREAAAQAAATPIAKEPLPPTPSSQAGGPASPMPLSTANALGAESQPPDIVLPAGRPLRLERLDLRRGQNVRGRAGERALVEIDGCLVVSGDRVRFENIDFVATASQQTATGGSLIELHSDQAYFENCTFRGAGGETSAVRYVEPAALASAPLAIRSGRLQLKNCMLAGVGAGIECCLAAPALLEIANCLHLGPGPLVALDRSAAANQPVTLALTRTTLRGASAAIACRGIGAGAGSVSVQASECIFAPTADGALLAFEGAGEPQQLLRSLEWTGQGSLLTPDVGVAAWRHDDFTEALDEASLEIAGLVISRVEFAGPAEQGWAASVARRWQAPLQSDDPPGIAERPDGAVITAAHWE